MVFDSISHTYVHVHTSYKQTLQNVLIFTKDFSFFFFFHKAFLQGEVFFVFKSRTLNSNNQTFKNLLCIQATDKTILEKTSPESSLS